MQVVFLEDPKRTRFGPLTLLRPSFDLRCGALLMREKLERRRSDWHVLLHPRPELAELVSERYPERGIESLEDGPALLLYGRVVVDEELLRCAEGLTGEALLTSGDETIGAYIGGGGKARVEDAGVAGGGVAALGLDVTLEVPARTVRYPWDLVALTADEIAADAATMVSLGTLKPELHRCARLVDEENVYVGEGSDVGPSVVLDARRGPIVVGRDVEVMPNAVIAGPAYIGDGSVVRAQAFISGGSSVGPVCKVGGEIQGSVFHSFSNKQHGGFLGHSYVGSWVNIGAATDNSDLRNDYGSVRVEMDGKVIDAGTDSVGATIGDHTKTAIGTKLTTGAVVGIFCNVLCTGFPPKELPAFSWGTPRGFVRHELPRALDTARRVMARRGQTLSPALERRITEVFDSTS